MYSVSAVKREHYYIGVRLLYILPPYHHPSHTESPAVERRKTPKDLCTTPPPPNNGLHNILKTLKHAVQCVRGCDKGDSCEGGHASFITNSSSRDGRRQL